MKIDIVIEGLNKLVSDPSMDIITLKAVVKIFQKSCNVKKSGDLVLLNKLINIMSDINVTIKKVQQLVEQGNNQ